MHDGIEPNEETPLLIGNASRNTSAAGKPIFHDEEHGQSLRKCIDETATPEPPRNIAGFISILLIGSLVFNLVSCCLLVDLTFNILLILA